MARVPVFDVNETLLDLGAMRPHFEPTFGDAGVRVGWSEQMIQSALVATSPGATGGFGDHAVAALKMTGEPGSSSMRATGRRSPGSRGGCPAHPEVGRLKPAPVPYRMAAEPPEILGGDLGEVAEAILAVDR
jgi:2-haloacid dehalogenase